MSRPLPLKLAAVFLLAILSLFLCVGALTTVDAIRQIRTLNWVDARAFGVGVAGSPCMLANDCSHQINAAMASAGSHGVPGIVQLPSAVIPILHPVWHKYPWVHLQGVGNGNPPAFYPGGFVGPQGTVIQVQAGATDDTAQTRPYNFSQPSNSTPTFAALQIDGGGNDLDGAQITDLTVDCQALPHCTTLYKNHANELSWYQRILALRATDFGFFICGADNNGGSFNCGGNGAQGDGPDEHLYILVDGASQYALGVVQYGEGGYKGLLHSTISPTSGGVVLWQGVLIGYGGTWSDIHAEGTINGAFKIGPASGQFCPSGCNGVFAWHFQDISYTNPPGSTQPALDVYDCQNCYMDTIVGSLTGAGCAIHDTNTNAGLNQCSGPRVDWAIFDDSYNIETNDPNFSRVFRQPTAVNGSTFTVFSSVANQLCVQYGLTPFGFNCFTDDVGGNFDITASGAGNWIFHQPYAVISLNGNITPLDGLNLQSLLSTPVTGGDAATVQNALLCGNTYWNTTTKLWNIGNIGGTGFACSWESQSGGWALTTSNASQPGTMSNTNFLATTSFFLDNLGHLLLGSGATAIADSGERLQVVGSERLTGALKTGITGNTDLHGAITLSAGTGTYTLSGTYTTGPECWSKDKTTPANANSCTCTTTVCTATGTGSDSIGYFLLGFN